MILFEDLSNEEKSDKAFIDIFREYKEEYILLGHDVNEKYFVKCYNLEKQEEIERDYVGRNWIDYHKQLEEGKYIYDNNGVGIWSTYLKLFDKVIEASWRYGKNIMVLSLVGDEGYVMSDLEVVGGRYEVLMYGDLNEISTWEKLENFLDANIILDISENHRNMYEGAKLIYDRCSRSYDDVVCLANEKRTIRMGIEDIFRKIIIR